MPVVIPAALPVVASVEVRAAAEEVVEVFRSGVRRCVVMALLSPGSARAALLTGTLISEV
jgi:hypothetical protein